MFGIKRQHGKVVITKSIPTSTNTGRQLASTLLENIKLKSELEKVSVPSNEWTPATKADIASDERVRAKVNEIMSGTSALEAKAKASQAEYNANSRFIIRDNNNPLLPTGCPNIKTANRIAEENIVLMNRGKQPFLTYQSWVDAGDSLQDTPNVAWRKYEAPAPKAVGTVPSFIVKHGYFLLYDNGICYYLSGEMKSPSILRRLASENVSGQVQHNEPILMSVSNGVKYRNVSQAEYNSLVTDTPCKADLFKVYIQFVNEAKVLMDTSKATPIWSKE
jgi:hypothetical protein